MTAPTTRYAKSGDVNVAYQVTGEGPDLVFVPGWISHVEMAWEDPAYARFLERLASFSRLILFDKRGTGMSDPVALDRLPTLEERMDDVRAVMDAVGSERATLLGISEGGAMSVLFAATYPQRTAGLVLYGSFARATRAEDYPWGATPEQAEEFLAVVQEQWSEAGSWVDRIIAPSADEAALARFARFRRMAASPAVAEALLRINGEIDVRSVLPAVSVPTLVLHRREQFIPIGAGRYLADHIEGARFVEVPGHDHLYFWGDTEAVASEIEEFVTGHRPVPEPERVLATVLFTDIVRSTERAVDVGDQRWRQLLDDHDAAVRRELERFRGREVKTTGDGFLAAFDGPARGVRCAQAVVEAARGVGLDVRAGLHTGECEARGDDLGGIAVHIGARVAALADASEVLVSGTVKDLVAGSGLDFVDRGVHELKGVPGPWPVYAVAP